MRQKVILTATNLEDKLIERYLEEKLDREFTHVSVGIGRTNAATNLVTYLNNSSSYTPKIFINIGFCGSSVKDSAIYDIVRPANFIDGDRDHNNKFIADDMYPETSDNQGATLITSSNFVENPIEEAYYDMEAFDMRAILLSLGLDFYCTKIVSDLCNLESYERIDEEKAYNVFKEVLDGYKRILCN